MKLESTHKALIQALLRWEADFLLIGGHASIYYGSERTTSDINIRVLPGVANGKKILAAFADLKLQAEDLSAEDFESHLVLNFGERPEEVDLRNYIVGVKIEGICPKNPRRNGWVVCPDY